MKRVLITGGSGFIGTNLADKLLKDGDAEVITVDICEPKISGHKKIWSCLDICNKEALVGIIRQFQPDQVIHLAARTDLRGKELADYNANILGVKNLLEALRQLPQLERVVFASSMYVCRPGYSPENFDDYAPHTVYGASKVLTEKIIKETPMPYTWAIIRPTSIRGPYFSEPYDKFFRLVLNHMYFHLGKKACKKTYGYIDNTVWQIVSILNADKEKIDRRIFYLGDYNPYNISEWADEIAQLENIRIPQLPFFFFRCGAWIGDFLKVFKINFPMTSFRLKNMTTDNIQNLEPIKTLVPELPVSRGKGNVKTLEWMNAQINVR
jgi:nucleoside-diphosphate-sugar epimerase